MNSLGVYEVDLYIKGQKFTHPVNVINELNDNIIGIDFMHRNKLIYDVNTRQDKFADEKMNGYLETKATLKVKKTVDFKIKVLLSFLKSGRQENHIISKISICTILTALARLGWKGRLKLSSNSHVHSHQQTRWKREGLLLLQ
jgi:hypothetical protein